MTSHTVHSNYIITGCCLQLDDKSDERKIHRFVHDQVKQSCLIYISLWWNIFEIFGNWIYHKKSTSYIYLYISYMLMGMCNQDKSRLKHKNIKEAVKRYFRWKVIYSVIYMLFARLYVRVGILLACGKNLHDRTISIRGEAWAHKTSLTQPLFIEVRVPIQEKEQSYTCVLWWRFCLFLRFWYLILKLFRQCWMRFVMYYIFRYKWHVHQHRSWRKKTM